MNEHLPECADKNSMPHYLDCFCDVLRACEQRCDEKRHAEVRAWSELSRYNFDHGFAAGLDAAREAVAACTSDRPSMRGMLISVNDALAAIDALKEQR